MKSLAIVVMVTSTSNVDHMIATEVEQLNSKFI